jgi:FO synthase
VTQDFINPEAAWPQIVTLEQRTLASGFALRERLAIYPEFARDGRFIDEKLAASLHRQRSADFYAKEPAVC